MIEYKWLGLKADRIANLLSIVEKQISDAYWDGDMERVAELEKQAKMFRLKLEYGETHDVPF